MLSGPPASIPRSTSLPAGGRLDAASAPQHAAKRDGQHPKSLARCANRADDRAVGLPAHANQTTNWPLPAIAPPVAMRRQCALDQVDRYHTIDKDTRSVRLSRRNLLHPQGGGSFEPSRGGITFAAQHIKAPFTIHGQGHR